MIFEGSLGSAWGGARAEGTRVGGGNELRLGPRGEDYRRGAAGNRHTLAAARRTAAERTAAERTAVERTAAERTAAERTAAITREMGPRSLVAPRGGWRIF